MNKTLLRFTWFSVKAAEYVLPILWKILVAAFYIILALTVGVVIILIL